MKTRGITEGAVFCALAVIFALLAYYVPFLIILTFFIPIPMVVLGKRQGLKVSIISSLAATIIISLFLGPFSGIAYGCLLLLVGCGLGYGYYKEAPSIVKITIGYLGFGILIVLTILGTKLFIGTDFISEMFVMLETSTKEVLGLYEQMGIDVGTMRGVFENQITSMKLIFPSVMLIIPAIFSYINILLSDFMLRRLGYSFNAMKPIAKWKVPSSLKTILLIFMVGYLIISFLGVTAIPEIYVANFMQIAYLIYFVMGVSFSFDLMESKKVKNKFIKVLIVFIVLILGLQFLFIFLGITDTYMDIRKLIPREGTEK